MKYVVLNNNGEIVNGTISESVQDSKDLMADKRNGLFNFNKKRWIDYQKKGYRVLPLNTFEILSFNEHERWSRWMNYLFTKGSFNSDGSFTIDKDSVECWTKQANQTYDKLTEKEKDSDRKEAKKTISLINAIVKYKNEK